VSAEGASGCPVPLRAKTVQLAHGGGGRLTRELVRDVFAAAFRCDAAEVAHDAALLSIGPGRLAFTTDAYVVSPRFFPGGDIGKLAVCGTVNDLAVAGARPMYMSAAFVLEEGLLLAEVVEIARSMSAAARACGVQIVTGDTKVVDRGKGDGVFVTTSGVGVVSACVDVHPRRVRPGDAILVSGNIGRHGIAVLSVRDGLAFETPVVSDCASIAEPVARLLGSEIDVRCLRDPTRGGLATALCEIALDGGVSAEIVEADVPVDDAVAGACELLGLDPLYVASEGRFVAIVPDDLAERALERLRAHPDGAGAARIGTIGSGPAGDVYLRTRLGTRRTLDLLSGEQLPRIC
jgi:hydrogenase expression/formation protein HypE